MSLPTSRGTEHIVKPDPQWKALLECAAKEVFSMMAGVELTEFAEAPQEPQGEQTAMVGLAGALCGMITIRCTSATSGRLAARMLGDEAATNPSMISDALGELCNMVAGNFKSKVTQLADHCMLSVPTVICGEDYVLQTPPPNEGFQTVLSLESEPIWFSLVVQG